jgi:hypothetical protein
MPRNKKEAGNVEAMGVSPAEVAESEERFQAEKLLKLIVEDLNPNDFTFDEIRQEFNDHSADRFKKSHLENLIGDGFIIESNEKGHYQVTSKGQSFL